MFSEYGGIPRQAKLLIYLSFIPNIAIGFIYTDLSYFLPLQGLSETLTGVTIGIMGATLVVASFPLGALADRYGRRKLLILGNVCASLSLIGFSLTSNFGLVALVAVLEGIGEAAYAVSVGALLAEKAGDEKRTAAFSLLAFLGWMAGFLGAASISSVFLFQAYGLTESGAHTVLYIIVALLSLSITPLLFKIGESAPVIRTEPGAGFLPRKSGRILAKYSVYSVMIAIGAGLFVPLMTLWYFKAYGVTDAVSGIAQGLTNLLTAGAIIVSPRLARKMGVVKAIVVTQASSMIFMVFVPSAPSFATAATIYAVRVFLMNLSNPLTQSLIMGLVAPDERGKASGLSASLWRLPNALSSGAGGALIQAGLLGLPFYIATLLYAAGISIFWMLFKNTRLPEESVPSQDPTKSSNLDGPEDPR